MTTIEFFFDIGSPYSYLAATQVEEVAARCGAEVDWRPFLLGGLFKSVGNTMPAALAPKAAYLFQDVQDWATVYGVPFRMTSHFPANSLTAQRALIAAKRQGGNEATRKLALAFYRAYWVDDQDIAEPAVLRDAIAAAGLDADAILAATQDAEVKAELKDTTAEAVERGAFGAPTFFVGERMFWGNDRLEMLERYLEGELEG